jgi:hypothetical protein
MDTNHNVVVCFWIYILDNKISDILQVKEKPPLKQFTFLTC